MKFFWWNRRSEPKFGETDLAIIADSKVAYYLVIRKRWWDNNEKEWMYEGTVLIVKNSILEVVASDYLYDENALIHVRGL